jgi:hypothetical protein
MRRVKMIPPLLALLIIAALMGCADVQERSHIVGERTGTRLWRLSGTPFFGSRAKRICPTS